MSFDAVGPKLDRRWMIVDEAGHFVSQRSHPVLNLVLVQLNGANLVVTAPGMPELIVQTDAKRYTGSKSVTVWDDTVEALLCPTEASSWFSRVLQEPVELVFFSEQSRRAADQRFAPPDALVSFADGFPVLICTEASLHDLNGRLSAPVPMSRFRPNIVLSGSGAYEEDSWERVAIGDMGFVVRSPCARCSVITVNEGEDTRTKEPLRTLSQYRTTELGVIFGQNLTHDAPGIIQIDDRVQVTPV